MEKGNPVTRTLAARAFDGESAGFPLMAQAARVHRQRVGLDPDTVELISSRPIQELPPNLWLEANINHWTIEAGLHARLDASRHDDRCRPRAPKALNLHGKFTRWANSMLIHWRKRPQHTTTDFIAHMAEHYDRRAVSAILSRSFPSCIRGARNRSD